jgi:hypothetical protein
MNTFSNGTQTVNTVNSPACGFVSPPPPVVVPPPVVIPPPTPPPSPAPVITFGSENQALACPVGYSGSGVVQTRQVTYTNGSPTAYGAWNTISSDCTFTPPAVPAICSMANVLICCFRRGTKIRMADGTERNIEDISIGDEVMTYDETTGTFTTSVITEVHFHEKISDQLFKMTLSNGRELTPNCVHMIFANGNYMPAKEVAALFAAGKPVEFAGEDGPVTLSAVEAYSDTVDLFNFHVRSKYDTDAAESHIGHNYIAEGIVVHNIKFDAEGCLDGSVDFSSAANACLASSCRVVPTPPQGYFCRN